MPDFQFSDEAGRARVLSVIQNLPLDKRWKVTWNEAKEKRRDAQNRLLWMWNNEIQRHMAEHSGKIASAKDWHEFMCEQLMPVQILGEFQGKEIKSRWRSSDASVSEFSEYLNKLDAHCCVDLGLILPHPGDVYHMAMAERRNGA